MSIFLTRFLITGIATPVNLISGINNFSFRRFLFYDTIGEAIWIFGYGGLGYLFGSQWEIVGAFLSNISGLLLGLLILVGGLWLGVRRLRSNTVIKESG
jgi:membrane protein DedA with SNARE-associated domain